MVASVLLAELYFCQHNRHGLNWDSKGKCIASRVAARAFMLGERGVRYERGGKFVLPISYPIPLAEG